MGRYAYFSGGSWLRLGGMSGTNDGWKGETAVVTGDEVQDPADRGRVQGSVDVGIVLAVGRQLVAELAMQERRLDEKQHEPGATLE